MRWESALTRRQVLDRLRHGTRQMQRKAAATGELESRPTRDGFVLAWAPGGRRPRGLCLTAVLEETPKGCIIRGKFGPDPHVTRILRYVAALVWLAVLAAALAAPAPEKALCLAAVALAAGTLLVWFTAAKLPHFLCPAAERNVSDFVHRNLLK